LYTHPHHHLVNSIDGTVRGQPVTGISALSSESSPSLPVSSHALVPSLTLTPNPRLARLSQLVTTIANNIVHRFTTISTSSEKNILVLAGEPEVPVTAPQPERAGVAEESQESTTAASSEQDTTPGGLNKTPSIEPAAVDEAGGTDSDADLVSGSDSGSDDFDGEPEKAGGKEKEPKSKERIQRLDQVYSKKQRKYRYKPTPKSDDDKLLRDALAEIFAGIVGMRLNQSPPVITPELLFHARLGLAERVDAEQAKVKPGKALIDELGVALQYIAEDHAATQTTLDTMSEHDEINFDLLWAIFSPKPLSTPRAISSAKNRFSKYKDPRTRRFRVATKSSVSISPTCPMIERSLDGVRCMLISTSSKAL
jgi:hypothetical protein